MERCVCAADRYDGDTLSREIACVSPRERLDGDLVAEPFHQHYRRHILQTAERPLGRLLPAFGQGANASAVFGSA